MNNRITPEQIREEAFNLSPEEVQEAQRQAVVKATKEGNDDAIKYFEAQLDAFYESCRYSNTLYAMAYESLKFVKEMNGE